MNDEDWRGRVDGRLSNIETRLHTVETKNAVDEVHRANVEKELTAIKSDIRDVKSGNTWILRAIAGAVIAAIVAFALRGGFVL